MFSSDRHRPIAVTRRRWLQGIATVTASGLLAACSSAPAAPTAAPAATSAPLPTQAPPPTTAPAPTAAPVPTGTSAVAPTAVGAATAAPAAAATPAALTGQPGGTLRVGMSGDAQKPDPHYLIATVDFAWIDAIFNPLVQYDEKMDPAPALAESWDIVNPTRITFHLAKNATFHDGKPFTADDVVYSFDRIRDPKTTSRWAPFLKSIQSIDTPDPNTVTLNLSKPDAPLLFALANCYIVPKGWQMTEFSKNLVGTGPFMFEEYIPNQSFKLKKNPNYFQKGLPYLDEIQLIPTRDPDAKLLGLETGQYDVIDTLSEKNYSDVQKAADLQIVISKYVGVTPMVILFNNAEAPTKDKRVRQALNYAFDKQTFLKTSLFGHGEIAHNLWPKEHWVYNPDLPTYDYDLKKAKDLLDAAGVKSIKTWTSPQYDYMVNHALLLKNDLAQIGVTMDLQQVEWTKYVADLYPTGKLGWSVAFTGYGRDYEPNNLLVPSYVTPNEKNYSNPKVDALADQGRQVYDHPSRKKIYDQLQAILLDDSPGVQTIFQLNAIGASKKLQGYLRNPRGDLHLHATWLQK